jgi:hypothetical protein
VARAMVEYATAYASSRAAQPRQQAR